MCSSPPPTPLCFTANQELSNRYQILDRRLDNVKGCERVAEWFCIDNRSAAEVPQSMTGQYAMLNIR